MVIGIVNEKISSFKDSMTHFAKHSRSPWNFFCRWLLTEEYCESFGTRKPFSLEIRKQYIPKFSYNLFVWYWKASVQKFLNNIVNLSIKHWNFSNEFNSFIAYHHKLLFHVIMTLFFSRPFAMFWKICHVLPFKLTLSRTFLWHRDLLQPSIGREHARIVAPWRTRGRTVLR